MTVTIRHGDCREILPTLPAQSVHCCVTSPPYFGLRDYGTAKWEGGDPDCDHAFDRSNNGHRSTLGGGTLSQTAASVYRNCIKCGAIRIDGQIGLEATPDAFVAEMVAVFREVRRVLRDDGTLWLNLADSYCSTDKWGGGGNGNNGKHIVAKDGSVPSWAVRTRKPQMPGIKPKDLIGIPWRVAFALQAPFYTGRIASELDRVWMAAMLDAEGCICGTEYENNGRTKTNLYISVTNTSVPVIANCERIFPQGMKHVYEKSGPSGRVCYRWDVELMETKAEFIREIYPYLVAKRKQAIVGYTFLEMQRGLISKKKGYLVEQHGQRSWLMAALSKLNGGEDVDLPDWVIEPPSMFEPGYYLRQDIIWSKPNPMPESVTDRCTKAHEYIFLLSKSARYYYDAEAIKEESSASEASIRHAQYSKYRLADSDAKRNARTGKPDFLSDNLCGAPRNKRSVWEVTTAPFSEAHFATFPPALIEPCILAGCPERCCSNCGAPWMREVERSRTFESGSGRSSNMPIGKNGAGLQGGGETMDIRRGPVISTTTLGWSPSCFCDAGTVRGTVLDPFAGAGTTGMVADRWQRDAILIELNPDYSAMMENRIRDDAGMFADVVTPC